MEFTKRRNDVFDALNVNLPSRGIKEESKEIKVNIEELLHAALSAIKNKRTLVFPCLFISLFVILIPLATLLTTRGECLTKS